MKRIGRGWHMVAQIVIFGSCWACSGETSEQSSDTQNPQDSAADDLPLARSLEPWPTTIRVVNGSSEVRSRYGSCTAPSHTIGIRPAGTDLPLSPPTCSKIDCATLPVGEVPKPETECTALACLPRRIDLAPGAADDEFNWDGIYPTLTKRNCYDATTFEPGAPMLARICFGKPAVGDYDIQVVDCMDYPFAYGAPFLDIELH